MTRKPTLIDDEGNETVLPSKWEICSACRGKGTTSAHLGAFTRDEMDEQGPEFFEDYMAGVYDKACEPCDGSGKVEVVDYSKLTKEQNKAYGAQLRDDMEYESICRMERMMGA